MAICMAIQMVYRMCIVRILDNILDGYTRCCSISGCNKCDKCNIKVKENERLDI
jgi:hypothetical protein